MQASQTDLGIIVEDAAEVTPEPQSEPLSGVLDVAEDRASTVPAASRPKGVQEHEAVASPFYDMGALERITGIVGVTLLVVGLVFWKFRPGEHRAALVILVCAMFLAILHYYTLEDTRRGAKR